MQVSRTMVNSLGFLFGLLDPRVGVGEAGDPEFQRHRQKIPKESLLSPAKKASRGVA